MTLQRMTESLTLRRIWLYQRYVRVLAEPKQQPWRVREFDVQMGRASVCLADFHAVFIREEVCACLTPLLPLRAEADQRENPTAVLKTELMSFDLPHGVDQVDPCPLEKPRRRRPFATAALLQCGSALAQPRSRSAIAPCAAAMAYSGRIIRQARSFACQNRRSPRRMPGMAGTSISIIVGIADALRTGCRATRRAIGAVSTRGCFHPTCSPRRACAIATGQARASILTDIEPIMIGLPSVSPSIPA